MNHAKTVLDRRQTVAYVAIASAFGSAPAVHDLPGVYIQPLD
jgi:hypothetical protein